MSDRLKALDRSGKSDREVDSLDDALFLFALRLVQGCTSETELKETWFRYAGHWRHVCDPKAFFYLRKACIERASQVGGELNQRSPRQTSLFADKEVGQPGAPNA